MPLNAIKRSELEDIFFNAFPRLDATGQQQALMLYQLLAAGQPVAVADFAEKINLGCDEGHALLDSWTGVTYDGQHHIDGFWGLSLADTTHQFNLGGHQLYTWCAWDLLFIPHLLGQSITAQTRCPVSGQEIQLSISQQKVESVTPGTTMMTFIKPDIEALKKNVINSFCQFIFFLVSDKEGKTWTQNHPDSFLLSIDEGYRLGKNIISSVFNSQ